MVVEGDIDTLNGVCLRSARCCEKELEALG
jgi:hypothetical protein